MIKEDVMAIGMQCQQCGRLYGPDGHACTIGFAGDPIAYPKEVTASNSQSVLIAEIADLRAQLAGEKAQNARLQGLLNQATMRIAELEMVVLRFAKV
jgi:hypothetical protein